MKKYTLIVGSHFSLANETDSDIMIDYNPGIWAIKTQKSALRFAREILAEGNEIRVTDYDNAKYHAVANKMIKELGLNQPLFEEIKAVEANVTNGKPSTLGALKKYLQVGTKIRIVNVENPERTRETEVIQVKNESIVTKKGETGQSHLYFEKAINWTFDNEGATYNSIREGKLAPCFKIEYMPNYGRASVDALNRAKL